MTRQSEGDRKRMGPNDPCACGSGKKFKRCCMTMPAKAPTALTGPAQPTEPRIDQLMARALAHLEAGRLGEAIDDFEKILRVVPDHADALHFSGLAAHQSGQTELAMARLTRAIQINPGCAIYFLNFGQVLEASGKPEDLDRAIACYRQAAVLDAGLEAASLKLAFCLLKKECPAEAAASFTQALGVRPDSHQAANGLGIALEKLGRLEQSIVCYRKAIALNTASVEAHNNLGTVLHKLGRFDEAIASYAQALQHRPDSADLYNNLGTSLRSCGRFEEAQESCQKAIALRPDFAEAHLNLANACKDRGLLRQAVSSYHHAIALAPRNSVAHTNLADTLVEQGKIDEAIESYKTAIEFESVHGTGYSNLLYLYSFSCCIPAEAERAAAEGWEKRMLTAEQRAAARQRASARSGVFQAQSRAGRKLRLGIVSAELGAHVVAVFLQPFLDELDRSRFHLTLFPTVGWSDARARHFRELADSYIPLIGVPDELAAERVRAEAIDILIDTTGHTSHCRLGIFAHRAAPVQCSYIGYWSTTGLTEMDWYITDDNYAGQCEAHFTEGLWKLPSMAHRYKGDESLPESAWTPDPEGTVWLGSFNKYAKIREETLRLWAKVMQAVPRAKLLLEDRAACETETHERILATLLDCGVAGGRLTFLPAVPNSDFRQHMALYNRLDIALDTMPFNSGTTAFDALWMGVPLVALEGNRVCGRMASSIVKALGQPQWAARSEEEYVSIVRALADDVEARKQLRRDQRAKMMRSPLCDARGLARSLEAAFEAMFDRWAAT